jgi:broad specificity phosphatase PhoE
LTKRGREQALGAGWEILQMTRGEKIWAYVSPFARARQTFDKITEVLRHDIVTVTEDPRIREQEWGHLRHPNESERISRERDDYSTFYYRLPDGESGADVFDRVSTFLETLHRDFRKSSYPENALIISHGLTFRIFLMRWFHWSVEEFESLQNPRNGQIAVMNLQTNGKYRLASVLARRDDE